MKELEQVIKSIREIDKDLDAYEYSNIPYDEYIEMIKEGRRGTRSLRNALIYNSGGVHIWASWMQECIENCKKTVNIIYTYKKRNEKPLIDMLDLSRLIKRIRETRDIFKKNTDNYSLYPIQSERIGNNLTIIAKYFEKYI